MCYLSLCEPFGVSVKSIFDEQKIRVIVDGGAYKGDTVKTFLNVFPETETIFAVEPDPGSYSKLVSAISDKRVRAVNSVLSSSTGETHFSSVSSRGSGVSGCSKRAKRIIAEKTTIDTVLSGNKCDLIKLDVEGDEREALAGASETIRKHSPDLIVSLYHRTDDLFDIPRIIKETDGDYRLYLRRPSCVPMWDINLYAVK